MLIGAGRAVHGKIDVFVCVLKMRPLCSARRCDRAVFSSLPPPRSPRALHTVARTRRPSSSPCAHAHTRAQTHSYTCIYMDKHTRAPGSTSDFRSLDAGLRHHFARQAPKTEQRFSHAPSPPWQYRERLPSPTPHPGPRDPGAPASPN